MLELTGGEMQKKSIFIRNTVLGEGMTKICVPIANRSIKESIYVTKEAIKAKADLLELRIDSIAERPSLQQVKDLYDIIRNVASDLPILTTFRTQRDGGDGTCDIPFYEEFVCKVIERKLGDLFDAETSAGSSVFKHIVTIAKSESVPVIGSYHNFKETPSSIDMVNMMLATAEMGADIVKLAVMAKAKQDVIQLFKAAITVDELLELPIIAISMGRIGRSSRFLNDLTGSCITFAQAGTESAPGQMPVEDLRYILKTLEQ